MTNNANMIQRLLLIIAATVICTQAAGVTLALWDFNSLPPDADLTTGTLQPVTGSGSAVLVGGVTGSFTASNGSSDPNSTDNSNWRITTWSAQGAQNKANGVRFNVPTRGYRGLKLRWDLRASNTASKHARLQYTTNGTDFVDFQVITMPYETWVNGQTASLIDVPGVEDNPNFGVRFVTEFESTALGSGLNGYVPCNPTNSYGSSGTLRFDMVSVFSEPPITNLTLLTYNVLGRHVADWTTNSAQVQAIGRQMTHLKPDIIGFQEIPEDNAGYLQMTNFVAAYLPGYYVAIGSYSDSVERNVVVSRFPIARAQSWLVNSSLSVFGYSGTFDRGLFEAQISVPGFEQPFHFFVTHLQAGSTQSEATRRGAEARAISNFFVTVYLSTNALHPYCLVGDMNEDIAHPRTYELQAIQTLTSSPAGLPLTTPLNPTTGDERTWSIQNANLTIRFDYVLPCRILHTNVRSGQVFRSDKVSPTAPPLQASDSAASSDHLPVLLLVRNPYLARPDQTISFGALTGRTYGDLPFGLSASASSGLPVSFNVLSGPATISGSAVTITGAGPVIVRATQEGNLDYNAAAPADQSFTVNKANQTISFGALGAKTYGNSPFSLSASASSGLPVSFSIITGPATINGTILTMTGVGNVGVRAAQGGNTNYNPASPVDRSFTVSKASSTTTTVSSPNPSCAESLVTLTASVNGVSPGGNVQFFDGASSLGVATIFRGQATLPVFSLPSGRHTNLTAQYAGDANHNSSASVSHTHVVAAGPLKWTGGDAEWNSSAAGTWNDSGLNSVWYCDTYAVILDDTATGISPINIILNSAVSPTSVTVNNSSKNYFISGSAGIVGAVTAVVKQGFGTLTLNTANTYSGPTTISGGSISLVNNGSIPNTATIDIANGAALDVSFRSDAALSVGTAQTLKGNGTFNIVGKLTSAGTIQLKANKSGVALANDQIQMQGLAEVTYGGILKLDLSGDPLNSTDSFKLFDATTYAGTFSSITPSIPRAGFGWNTNTLVVDGTLRIVATDSINLIAEVVASGTQLHLAWPADHLGWVLQSQTSAPNVGLSTNWFDVPGSAATNELFLPIGCAQGAVFYRLRYSSQHP